VEFTLRFAWPQRWRAWHGYAVLVALSCLWQARPVAPPRDAGVATVDVLRQTVAGPVDGPPVRIAYREQGAGTPVVYLHGSPGSGADAERLARHLAPAHRVIAPDLPGFGASTRRVPDYGIEAHARYVLALMEALGIERTHLVAHSMGSGVAYHVAHLAPHRVASIVAYGGIGLQEGEGSGDWRLERVKYAAGFVVLVGLPEVLPHFGLLGPRSARLALVRNFWDSDLRPMRGLLESLEPPLLILHGRRDPLVPAWVAREHHRLVRHSALVMMEASHFMVFTDTGAERLAEEIGPFLARHDDPGVPPARSTVDFRIDAEETAVAGGLDLDRQLGPWGQLGALVAATFVSEDLTCIAAGLLARTGRIDLFVAVLGCFLGIFVSDVGLWLAGRLVGRRVLRWGWVARRVGLAGVDRMGATLDRHLGQAVVASRFLPGTRVPLYVLAGVAGRRPVPFFLWLAVAAAIWTPLLVLAALIFGPAAARPFEALVGTGWLAWAGAAAVLLLLVRALGMLVSWRGRARLAASVAKLWRWEFWPVWLFYLPLLPWIAWLALRHGGLTTPTATNPAMPHGGFVGESKSEILARLPEAWVEPWAKVEPGAAPARLAALVGLAEHRGWSLPIVLKPDEGQRGVGVRLIHDWEAAQRYLEREPRAVLAQTYHRGPYEAGIFYYRLPGERPGGILSITDKVFPEVVGDGRSTLGDLVLRDRRLRMQWRVFHRRLAERVDEVPAAGRRVRLAVAGNHCQGTMFLDGGKLATDDLARALDEIVHGYPGFCFGRFDVRYADRAAFTAGRGFRILELNGVTSESTNVYDPSRSLAAAYVTLARQWSLAFRIGAANRRAGHATSSVADLVRAARSHYRRRAAEAVAD
jgi:pimeloyl-ACP methyl ester carboxylesterase/membrane protein DedA with SNARE-associated domain